MLQVLGESDWSQARLEQVWQRLQHGHIRTKQGKVPIADINFGKIVLRPTLNSEGAIVRVILRTSALIDNAVVE